MSQQPSDTAVAPAGNTPVEGAGYWAEFRVNWRAIVGATIGLGAGNSLSAYVNSVFGPYLLEAFGWSKSEFALVGALGMLTLICIPIAGRMADIFGVRRVALVGIIFYPLCCLLFSFMNGDIRIFYGIMVLKILLTATTTSTVYSRVVVERVTLGRGLALAIVACGPALVGAVGSPLLTLFMDQHGWRAGYQMLALFSASMGVVTLLLLPTAEKALMTEQRQQRNAKRDYGIIARTPAFWIIILSTLLCSLPYALAHSQLKVMLLEHGISSTVAGYMVSIFATGVLVGRFVAGLALDRWPTYLVAAICMGVPCTGMFIMASPTHSVPLLGLAVMILGLSYGAEADILAYVTARYFPISIYSSVLGLLMPTAGLAIAIGSGLLSWTLTISDSFRPFMLGTGIAVLLGGLNFLFLKRIPAQQSV
jgi:MFS family permease